VLGNAFKLISNKKLDESEFELSNDTIQITPNYLKGERNNKNDLYNLDRMG
jgi:hypothetical protein